MKKLVIASDSVAISSSVNECDEIATLSLAMTTSFNFLNPLNKLFKVCRLRTRYARSFQTAVYLILLLAVSNSSSAQTYQYTNYTYSPQIKSVECYNTAQDGSFPIIQFGSNEQIQLAFDDLTTRSRNYYYTVEHCDAQWNTSNLSPSEYLQGFQEDRIMDYNYSSGTIQPYIHYSVRIPNQNIIPKLSGNYLLKVYEDGDQSKTVLTRRIYIAKNAAQIAAELIPSSNVALRLSNQKLNFQVDYGGLYVQNPYADIRVVVMQNEVQSTAQLNNRPSLVRGSLLIYNDVYSDDFAGGNEYRHFDIRTLKLNSDRVARIFKDTANAVLLLGDESRNQRQYEFNYDNNGNFFIRNQDGRDARTDGDYAQVYFSLESNKSAADGSIYISGKFNDFRTDESSRLRYDASRNRYYINLLLKQGVYDYQYVWTPNTTKRPDSTGLEGSYFETENSYQLLVYHRAPGARWEELIGYRLVKK